MSPRAEPWADSGGSFGPRFWLDDSSEAAPVSLRWVGLRRAWRTVMHLRLCLLALAVAAVGIDAFAPRGGGETWLVLAILLPAIGFFCVMVYLTVMLMLGLVQVVTGWPLHELDAWYGGLAWWKQILVLPVLIVAVCLPAIVLFIASVVLTLGYLGLIK